MYRSTHGALVSMAVEKQYIGNVSNGTAAFAYAMRVKVTYQGHPVSVFRLTDSNGETVIDAHNLGKFLAKVDQLRSSELARAIRR